MHLSSRGKSCRDSACIMPIEDCTRCDLVQPPFSFERERVRLDCDDVIYKLNKFNIMCAANNERDINNGNGGEFFFCRSIV